MSVTNKSTSSQSSEETPHRAGAFDIRNFIALLIGIYGVVLVITGLVSSDGRTINLVAGLGMVVVASAFVVWARLRPVIVPADVHSDAADEGETTPTGGRRAGD